jgi:predicted phage terminase large subunit-like protein
MKVHKVTPRGNKDTRISSLDVLIGAGKLRFSTRHRLLIEQLVGFPSARHDDGPDALEIAVNLKSIGYQPSYSGVALC